MKKLIFCFLLPLLAACADQKEKGDSDIPHAEQIPLTIEKSSLAVMETFSGILPCADCNGIETTLKIFSPGTTYELTSIYLGKTTGEDKFVQTGNINTERGFENDADATLYILNFDKAANEHIYFVRLTNKPGIIQMLDADKKFMADTNLNYSLQKL